MEADSVAGVTFFRDVSGEFFDSFGIAFISMFRIMLGSVDWWFDLFPTDGGTGNAGAYLFLISYVVRCPLARLRNRSAHGSRWRGSQVLVNWVFFQVSIAVLLDNFLAASNAMKREKHNLLIQAKRKAKRFKNPLDPLLLRLSKEYINDADLSERLQELFKASESAHFL